MERCWELLRVPGPKVPTGITGLAPGHQIGRSSGPGWQLGCPVQPSPPAHYSLVFCNSKLPSLVPCAIIVLAICTLCPQTDVAASVLSGCFPYTRAPCAVRSIPVLRSPTYLSAPSLAPCPSSHAAFHTASLPFIPPRPPHLSESSSGCLSSQVLALRV